MRIVSEHVAKAQSIFLHLQLVTRDSVQQYDELNQWRTGITIGRILRNDGSADMVYCHTAVFNTWHKRIWAKRVKEIPYRAIVEYNDELKIWRVGFSSYPE